MKEMTLSRTKLTPKKILVFVGVLSLQLLWIQEILAQEFSQNPAEAVTDPNEAIFLEDVQMKMSQEEFTALSNLVFQVRSKDEAIAKPLRVRFEKSFLEKKEYWDSETETLLFSVFGLYENYTNEVKIIRSYENGRLYIDTLKIQTGDYVDEESSNDEIEIETKVYSERQGLGFSYILLKTLKNGPQILDVDGELRWAAREFVQKEYNWNVGSVLFYQNSLFTTPDQETNGVLLRLHFDGSITEYPLQTPEEMMAASQEQPAQEQDIAANTDENTDAATDTNAADTNADVNAGEDVPTEESPDSIDMSQMMIAYDIVQGPRGILLELAENPQTKPGGFRANNPMKIVEVTEEGTILDSWDIPKIISEYMESQGDDPTLFVQEEGEGFMTMNSVVYYPPNNSLLISDRESYVISIGYYDKRIRWIMGDTTKLWYTFESLKSLALEIEGNPPIGQHSLIVDSNDDILLFNNGEFTLYGTGKSTPGEKRTNTLISRYKIDSRAMTAKEIQSLDLGIFSSLAGSVDERNNYFLLDFAYGDETEIGNLLIVDARSERVLFQTTMTNTNPADIWHADIIDWDSLLYE